jgi:hypothetical protein
VTNEVQLAYIRAAEAMTDPQEDSVLDGVGMVVTRKPPDRDWLVHSSYLGAYRRGERTSFPELLENGTSPVVMTNYRWGWLGEEVLSALRARYLPLANGFWVLGGRFEGREGSFEVLREGRYFVASGTAENPLGVVVDGMAASPFGVRFLSQGVHSFTGATDEGLVVGWVGPHLQAPVSLQGLRQGDFLLVPF